MTQDIYSKIAGALLTTVRKLSLYPAVHPVVKKALSDTYNLLINILRETKVFTISVAPSGLLANDEIVTGKNQHLIDGLADGLKRLKIESLTFLEGLSPQELEGFLKTLHSGSVSQIALEHIKINEFSYIRIEKGKEIDLKDKEEGEQLDKTEKSQTKTYTDSATLIELLAKEFTDKKRFTSNAKNMIKKAVSSGLLEKENLISQLASECQGLGCPSEQLGDIAGAIEDMLMPKERMVKVSSSKLKQLVADKERVDNIIRNIADGLVVVDAEGKVSFMNPAAEKILGIDKQTIAGKLLRNHISDEHLLTLVKDLKLDKEGAIAKDIEIVTPDESTKKVLRASSAVIENSNGNTVGMVAILNDVTKQREIEKLKSDFVANVSHELRTPLAVMQQNLSLLLNGLTGALNDDQKKFIESSLDNLGRLRRLINDVLDIAAIEAGKLKLNKSVRDINESVVKVVDFIKTLAKTKGISIDVVLPQSGLELEIDKDRIEQVLLNLLGNAIKFTPEGGKITVCVRDGQSEISVSVKDTGIGIKKEDIDRIFNKFEQLRPSYQSGIGGTGLGLPIAKEIIQLHQGRLSVESKIGEGSVFLFTLPKVVR